MKRRYFCATQSHIPNGRNFHNRGVVGKGASIAVAPGGRVKGRQNGSKCVL